MQTVKKTKHREVQAKYIALTAMFTALTTVTTAFIKIPAPLGYLHAGDAAVYLSASLLPAPLGFIAAGVGGALADVLSGYAVWAVPTLLIKMLDVLPFFLMRLFLGSRGKDDRILRLPVIAALAGATAVTVGGYYVANLLLYDQSAALAEIPFNAMQAAVAAVLFTVAGAALDAVQFKRKLTGKFTEK